MERPRHPIKLASAALLLGAGVFFGLKPQEHLMSADDWFVRERVLSTYPFTSEAVDYLKDVPYFNRNTTTNGGGYYHNDFPYGRWIETFSDQDEAILHEDVHALLDFLIDKDPSYPEKIMEAMQIAVAEDKPGGFFKHLDWGFGDKWKGVDHSNYSEWFASTGSRYMGNVSAMPEALHGIYKPIFRIDDDAKQIQINPVTPGRIENQHGNQQK